MLLYVKIFDLLEEARFLTPQSNSNFINLLMGKSESYKSMNETKEMIQRLTDEISCVSFFLNPGHMALPPNE